MTDGKRLKINGTDYSGYFTRTGYSVGYESVQGSNAGQMLDGTYTEDELKIRTVVTLNCMPLTQEQLSALLNEVYGRVYHMVEYFDPKTNGYREEEMRRHVTTQTYRGFGAGGDEYWTRTSVTFTSR